MLFVGLAFLAGWALGRTQQVRREWALVLGAVFGHHRPGGRLRRAEPGPGRGRARAAGDDRRRHLPRRPGPPAAGA